MTVSLFIYHCSGRSVKAHEIGASPRYKEAAAAGDALLIFPFFFCVFSVFFTHVFLAYCISGWFSQ